MFCNNVLLTIKSGRRTPIAEMPTPALAVPYAAPKHVKTIADVQPIAPKKGCRLGVSPGSLIYAGIRYATPIKLAKGHGRWLD